MNKSLAALGTVREMLTRESGPDRPLSGSLPAEALEARAALRLTAQLGVAADALPHDINERLRHARMRALEVALTRVGASRSGLRLPLRLGGRWSAWAMRLASVAPLIALVAGLGLIVQAHDDSQIVAAADVDTALLADELPPAAYGDPGFSEFLRKTSE